MSLRTAILLAVILSACGKQDPIVVPNNAATLSVAQCPQDSAESAETYATELKGSGELRLWVDPELTKPFGGVNSESVYGRAYSDTVWAVLVHDFAGAMCEGYVSKENVVIIGVLDPESL